MNTNRDIDRLFQQFTESKTFTRKIKSGIIILIQFLILFVFFFSILNFPAYFSRISFFYTTKIRKQSFASQRLEKVDRVIRATQTLPTINPSTIKIDPPSSTDTVIENLPNNRLYIPKINIDAPIIWDTPAAQMIEQLREGVTHYQGTAKPGQNGNVVITGHSSNFWWDPGQYKQVFALLDQLKVGDKIAVTYQDEPFVYEVEKIFVVNPGQIEVLNPTDHSMLTLLTCTPVGTTINRLIIQAKQISPISGTAENIPKLPEAPKNLPSVR